MPSQIAGNLILDQYIVLDSADAPLTGMTVPTDVSLTLYRQSGVVMVAASETMAWAEIGTTGVYYYSFTPQQSGLYVLYIRELNVNSGLRQNIARYEVFAAGAIATPSYANAFCAESDVERYLLQPIDGTTKPSDTQVASWAEGGAAALMSLMAGLGSSITPTTVTAGSRLEKLLREANAIKAALDATVAQVFGTSASKTDKAQALLEMWESYYGKYVSGEWVPGFIGAEISSNTVSLSTNHTLSGDTLARTPDIGEQDIGWEGGGIRMRDLF